MLRCLVRLYKQAVGTVLRAARRAGGWLRGAWRRHGSRVANDAAYAASTAAVVSGLFGGVPLREAAATVLAVVLGVHVTGRKPRTEHTSDWHDDPFDPFT